MRASVEVRNGDNTLRIELSTKDVQTHSFFSDREELWARVREQVRVTIAMDLLQEEQKGEQKK